MLSRLVAGDVRFVVIGGVAANLLGSARLTNDLDICYQSTPENLERLVATLNGWHAYLRGVEPGLPWVLDARTLRTTPILTLVTDEGWIDVIDRVAGVGGYEKVLAASLPAEWEELRFRTLGLDGLIAAKRATGRRKDHEALLELLALREERRRRDQGD